MNHAVFELYAPSGRYGTLTLQNRIESPQNSGVFESFSQGIYDAVFTGRN
jgi:hypothetical protein